MPPTADTGLLMYVSLFYLLTVLISISSGIPHHSASIQVLIFCNIIVNLSVVRLSVCVCVCVCVVTESLCK